MQRLQGILAGIVADGKIAKEELEGLKTWLNKHASLKTSWPYDEMDAIITGRLSDGIIDDKEHSACRWQTENVPITAMKSLPASTRDHKSLKAAYKEIVHQISFDDFKVP